MGIVESFPGVPPAAASRLAAKLLNKHSAHDIAEAIEVLIDVLDLLGGDADAEEGDAEDSFAHSMMALHMTRRVPGDITSDADDTAWVEWHTMRGAQKKGPNLLGGHEDDEDDDPAGQYDEDVYSAKRPAMEGPGCSISDPGGCEHDGREQDDGY